MCRPTAHGPQVAGAAIGAGGEPVPPPRPATFLFPESLSAYRTLCLKAGILLHCNTIPDDTGAMSTLVEGFSWVVERPRPEDDLVVSEVVADDGGEELIRIVGLDACDYLTGGETLALANALAAASARWAKPAHGRWDA
jgi:hypothetical protein